MVIFYKKWKKFNEIQLTKDKMDLNIRKTTHHPPSPAEIQLTKNSSAKNEVKVNEQDKSDAAQSNSMI